MLAKDPRELKAVDRLKALFVAQAGVESVAFTLAEPLPGTAQPGTTVNVMDLLPNDPRMPGDVEYLDRRPIVSTTYMTLDGDDGAAIVRGLIDAFRQHVAGRDPARARPLPHVNAPEVLYFPLRIDGWPVRVISSYSPLHAAFRLSIDTLCPSSGAATEAA